MLYEPNIEKESLRKAWQSLQQSKALDHATSSDLIPALQLNERLAILKAAISESESLNIDSQTLINMQSEINRIKKKMFEMDNLHKITAMQFENNDFAIGEESEFFYVEFFVAKPTEEVINLIEKRNYFQWSPKSGVKGRWTRKITKSSLESTKIILIELLQMPTIYPESVINATF